MKNYIYKSEVAVENLAKKSKINKILTKSGYNILTVNHENDKKSILIESENLIFNSLTKKNELINLIKNKLNTFLKHFNKNYKNVLVVGLGNKNINCDCLGPKVCNKVINYINNKIFLAKSNVYTICPDVMGKTGIDSINIIDAIKDKLDIDLVLLIDSLSTKEIKRIATSIQISTLGLTPGSGSKIKSNNLSSKVLSTPTISIGIPLVSFIFNKNDSFKNLIVTPKDVTFITDFFSDIISSAINLTFYSVKLSDLQKYKI